MRQTKLTKTLNGATMFGGQISLNLFREINAIFIATNSNVDLYWKS